MSETIYGVARGAKLDFFFLFSRRLTDYTSCMSYTRKSWDTHILYRQRLLET